MILPLHGMQYRWWETSPVKAHTQIQSGRIISQEICYEAASQTENTITGCMQYILPARKRVPWKGIINVCQQAYRAKFIIGTMMYISSGRMYIMQIMDCLKNIWIRIAGARSTGTVGYLAGRCRMASAATVTIATAVPVTETATYNLCFRKGG